MRIAPIVRSYKQIAQDYAYQGGVFCEDTPKVRRTKWVVEHCLTPADRTIIILYAELGSYRKLGARLRVSYVTAMREVNRIKRIILAEYAALTTEP